MPPSRRVPPPRRSAAVLLATLVGLSLTPGVSQAATTGPDPSTSGTTTSGQSAQELSTRTDGITNVLGDYDGELREAEPRADGIRHVDTPAVIAALRKAHVNTYAFLIYHSTTDWSDLVHEFLPAARQAQINVWVYLVPPSECCSQPYGKDYVAWARSIAGLSVQYPNLTAWAIDDFAGNLDTFTPGYMKQIDDAAWAVNPALRLFPILYAKDYNPTFMDRYAPYIDGAIVPYEGDTFLDLNNLGPFRGQLDAAVNAMKPLGKRLYLMPYASPLSLAPLPPSADTVSEIIRTGLEYMHRGALDGIMPYLTPLAPAAEQCTPPAFPNILTLRSAWNSPTAGGDYAQASQQVTVDPNAGTQSISFQQFDTFITYPADLGYYEKQLLVNGVVVWRQDIAADAARTWSPQTVDVSSQLHGTTSATISFRLVNLKGVQNFGAIFSVAAVQSTGLTITNGDFASQTGWAFDSTSPTFGATYDSYQSHPCDPQRQQHVFDAVRYGYGPNSLVYRGRAATGVTDGQRTALVSTARDIVSQHQSGNDAAASAEADALADKAGAMRLQELADQAARVAADLAPPRD